MTDEPMGRQRTDRVRQATVVVMSTVDTKRDEAQYLAERVRDNGAHPRLMDMGWSKEGSGGGDIGRDAVLKAADVSVASFRSLERNERADVVCHGASRLLRQLIASNEMSGVVAIGGGRGTWLAGEILRELPFEVPKLMVSTVAGVDSARIIGNSNLVLVPSLTDILGLNFILKRTLDSAAAAITAMARTPYREGSKGHLKVAMTVFGVTSEGAKSLVTLLEQAGMDVVTFHANGVGGAVMEELIADGMFDAVIDWTTTELADEMIGGLLSAGPNRLRAAAHAGIPQIVVPGATDIVNFGPKDEIPIQFRSRTLHAHTPQTYLLRTNATESESIGRITAARLRSAKGPWALFVPTGGFSALADANGEFADPVADQAYVDGFRAEAPQEAEIQLLPYNINDHRFADAVATRLVTMMAVPRTP